MTKTKILPSNACAPREGYAARQCVCGVTFYRHKRSRQNMCCACKSTTKSVRIEVVPAVTTFTTMDEVNAYLGGEKIRCTICGEEFEVLGRHLRVHGVTQREYKQRMGIPLTRKLSVARVLAVHRERAKRLIASGKMKTSADPEHARLITKSPRPLVKPTAPAAIAAMRHGIRAKPSMVLVPAVCSVCGGDAGLRKEHVVLKKACSLLCKGCKRTRREASMSKWLERKGFANKNEYMKDLYQRKKRREI